MVRRRPEREVLWARDGVSVRYLWDTPSGTVLFVPVDGHAGYVEGIDTTTGRTAWERFIPFSLAPLRFSDGSLLFVPRINSDQLGNIGPFVIDQRGEIIFQTMSWRQDPCVVGGCPNTGSYFEGESAYLWGRPKTPFGDLREGEIDRQ